MRTQLVDGSGNPLYTNRLIEEDSPYLRQHAHNPVDWYPWGEEAFAQARAQDKPIFLSIGYSTCHWCHVMEHESFDNEEIAAFLNGHFVSIKLDREQRPDLDDIYMTGVQMMTGQGGWPMSNFLDHEGQPFYAGTYYPPASFLHVLRQLSEAWRDKRDDVDQQAARISESIAQYVAAASLAEQVEDPIQDAADELLSRLDAVHGGFGDAPKFPNESQLLLLLENYQRHGNARSGDAVRLTLDRLYQGGIYDQVAGGFHRYAVDREWLVPHFEKMLYNQAQLLTVYAKAACTFNEPAYRRIAEDISAYVGRDMRAPGGAFYSATDADSEGVEGRFFVWTPEELVDALGQEDADLVMRLYGVSVGGNFEGRNILNLNDSLEAFASQNNMAYGTLEARLGTIRLRLYDVRETREHPLRDEKIIAGWNGMMIGALARAGLLLRDEGMLSAANDAAGYLWQHHWDSGELHRISLEGHVSIPGNLEDYACLADGMLSLFRATDDSEWLDRAERLIRAMNERFRAPDGGYFMAAHNDDAPLITRPKSPMDGATPSANSYAVSVLAQHVAITGSTESEQILNEAIGAFSGLINRAPSAFSYMLVASEALRDGQNDYVQYAAEGRVRIQLDCSMGVVLRVSIAEGWHVNGSETADDLIATSVSGAGIESVRFPKGTTRSLPFLQQPVELLDGDFVVSLELDEMANGFELVLQACNDSRCLAPERLRFRF